MLYAKPTHSYVYKILSIALKQPEVGPRSSGDPILVFYLKSYFHL